jgi:DmsE family decaheme c-type cytochrome
VKNCDRIAVDIAFGKTSSAEIPQKPKVRPNKKFLFFTASALIFCASLGLTQYVRAEGALTVADIKAALGGSAQAVNSEQSGQPHQQYAGDEALSALSSFAQQVGIGDSKLAGAAAVNADRQFDDQAYAALQDFAQRLGAAQPQSTKALSKVAAEGAEDALREFFQKGSAPQTSPSNDKAKAPVAAKAKGAPVDATFVGAKTCLTCHASQTAEFEKTLMGKIGKTQKGKFDCENCHGPGSAHVKAGGGRGVGGIISFRPEDQARTAEENNAVCLTCHEKGNRTLWHGSTHETRGLMCTNCHTIMKSVSRKAQLKTELQPDTCFQCHKDIRAKMLRSAHMPVREGKVVCTNCHNPHGSYTESLLKEATVNDTCFQCHAEKRGPFLWEHPPVVESCLNCHDPHGSMNSSMLTASRPRLCQRCHNVATRHPANPRNPTAIQAMGGGCVNCHSQFHGSNAPGGQRFLR